MHDLVSCNIFQSKMWGRARLVNLRHSHQKCEMKWMWMKLSPTSIPAFTPSEENLKTCFNKLAFCRNNCQHVNTITFKSEWISNLYQTAKINRCQSLLRTLQKHSFHLYLTLLFQLQFTNCVSICLAWCKFHVWIPSLRCGGFLGDVGVVRPCPTFGKVLKVL